MQSTVQLMSLIRAQDYIEKARYELAAARSCLADDDPLAMEIEHRRLLLWADQLDFVSGSGRDGKQFDMCELIHRAAAQINNQGDSP